MSDPVRMQELWQLRLRALKDAEPLGGLIEGPRFEDCDATDYTDEALDCACNDFAFALDSHTKAENPP